MRFFARKPNSQRELCVFSRKCTIHAADSAFFEKNAEFPARTARFFVRKQKLQCIQRVFFRKSRNCNATKAFFRQEALSARLGGGEGRKKEARPPRKVGFFREKTEMSAKSCLRRENVCVCVFIC